jgi:hypothetical protein
MLPDSPRTLFSFAMSDKLPCTLCGALILPTTAARTNGLCMPCKGGYRQQIEESKRRAVEEREEERLHPFRGHWRSLVERVHSSPNGFDSLSEDEKILYAVGLLQLEVYNGGFDQYFFNSSSSHYQYAEKGLIALGAMDTLDLLHQAKEMLFSGKPVPEDTLTRRQALRSDAEGKQFNPKLDGLNDRYWEDPEELDSRLRAFAFKHGLVP